MENQKMPEYETIRAAVAGETWAVEKVLMCYKDEIDRQATVKKRQPDGSRLDLLERLKALHKRENVIIISAKMIVHTI